MFFFLFFDDDDDDDEVTSENSKKPSKGLFLTFARRLVMPAFVVITAKKENEKATPNSNREGKQPRSCRGKMVEKKGKRKIGAFDVIGQRIP